MRSAPVLEQLGFPRGGGRLWKEQRVDITFTPISLCLCAHARVPACLYLYMDTHTHTRDMLCLDLPPATIYKGLINQKNKFANSAFPQLIRKTNLPTQII